MVNLQIQKTCLIVSFSTLMVSLWQIEEIWRSLQNGWVYGLPFGFSTYNYWFAHDFWFIVIFLSFVLLAYGVNKHA
jgi:hypothetical protein